MIFDENGRPVPEDPWSSIVDLMSALVLVLFLAVIFFVTNFSEVSAALEVERETLANRSAALKVTEERLKSANAQNLDLIEREERLKQERQSLITDRQQLIDEKTRLLGERESLVADKARLEAQRASLLKDRDELAKVRASLLVERESLKQRQDELLADREKLLGDKEKLLGDKSALTSETEKLNAKVLALQAAIKDAASKQSNLMNSLASSFEAAKTQGVSVDREAGKIVLKSEVLFSEGKATLTENGKRSIESVSEGLLNVLSSKELRSQVEGIMVEGHTSSSGKYVKNLKLSSERAINTLEFLLSLPKLKASSRATRSLFFAGAFGESRPVLNNGREDEVKSRRIEIRLLFNQSQVKSLSDAISR